VVANRRRPQFKILDVEKNYQSLVESVKDYAIFMLDKNGKVLSWDQGARKQFGYNRKEIIGKNFSVIFTPGDVKKGVPKLDLKEALKAGRYLDEKQYRRKNGKIFWSSGALTSTTDKKGLHLGFSKIMRDVTEQKNLHKIVTHQSTHDFLTGLPNRRFFEETFLKAIHNAKKMSTKVPTLALLFLDFNNFKKINDAQGHKIGDFVLIEIAHRLIKGVRLSDMVARLGGDEFVILSGGFANEKDVRRFCEKILKIFRVPIIKKNNIRTTVSIGVAIYPQDGVEGGDILHRSDTALYDAKKLGGNRYRLYSELKKN
jgi:diguanylate cyclase (GGDEF)-like protein/PAS domain S-box-containing protein